MMILGEKFYYMHNYQEAKFDLSEIQALLVQPADIVVIDTDTMQPVREDTIYVVIVAIDEETFAATKPLDNEKHANKVAYILQKKLHRMHGDNGAYHSDVE